MPQSSKIVRAVTILSLGVALVLGGIYLWGNQFNINLFSSAGRQDVSHLIILGDYVATSDTLYAKQVHAQLETTFGRKITYTEGYSQSVTLPLRDQLIAAYQQLPQPVSGKVVFLVVAGQETVMSGLKRGDSATAIAAKIEKDISDMVSLAANRPGVFPDGFSFYISDMYDPTDGISSNFICSTKYPYESKTSITTLRGKLSEGLASVKSLYPDKVTIVPVAEAFVGHAAGAASDDLRWFTNCNQLTEKGSGELARLFVDPIQQHEK